MAENFDIIIIGGGNAGFGVSAVASEAGKSIAFIEERDFGGTCPNRGCTPKKFLVAAGQTLHELELAQQHGIEVGDAKLDWSKMIERSKNAVSFIPGAMEGVAAKRGTVFYGKARFVGPNSVEVDGKTLEADNIVIATGSRTRPLPIPGAEYLKTSDDVLADEDQPESIVFIGGGVIAMEFSHVYARAGTQTTILEVAPRLLPNIEADAVAAIQEESERIGIDVKTAVKVKEVQPSGDKFKVIFEQNGVEQSVEAARVVNGAGRIANVDGLNLEAANVEYDAIALQLNQYLQSTSNPSVWAAGDVLVTSPQLSPVATYEGRIVGENIVNGLTKVPDYSALPSAIYTTPAVSSVGLTEAQARDKGMKIKVSVSDMREWFSGKTYAETVAWSKVIIDEETDRFVGAHLVGHRGEDVIHMFALAMRYDISASDIKDNIFAYPTFSSDFKNLF